jgi:hypothetical protein
MEGDYFYKLPNYHTGKRRAVLHAAGADQQRAVARFAGQLEHQRRQCLSDRQYEDGIIATSMDGGNSLNSVSVGVEEIKVLTSAMPAEYGHATSGALIVVKKSAPTCCTARAGTL